MAVEIREIIIKAIVEDGENEKENGKGPAAPAALTGESQEKIVEECVEQVLRILKRKNYR